QRSDRGQRRERRKRGAGKDDPHTVDVKRQPRGVAPRRELGRLELFRGGIDAGERVAGALGTSLERAQLGPDEGNTRLTQHGSNCSAATVNNRLPGAAHVTTASSSTVNHAGAVFVQCVALRCVIASSPRLKGGPFHPPFALSAVPTAWS